MQKIPVGIIGATGIVGQNYIGLLAEHPWFEVRYLAASPHSAGKPFGDAVAGRWHMATGIPDALSALVVADANQPEAARDRCRFVFSALKLEKSRIMALEDRFAGAGIPVVSNNSAHRTTADVPVLIPEINAHHTRIIPAQQRCRDWGRGFVVVKPNCSVQSFLLPVHALMAAGYEIRKIILTTLEAISGAGHPGVASLDIVDNIVPYIAGEEEKSEREVHKILGRLVEGKIQEDHTIAISAHCNRVPVVDGHTACVSVLFGDRKPSADKIREIWQAYRGLPQELALPSAPKRPILYRTEKDRPQPRKDRQAGRGMAVSVGRLRSCKVFDYRFVGLSHNTIRGAAGGGILNAELLAAQGYFGEGARYIGR